MTMFTINTDNDITAHGTPEDAAAANATQLDSFSSQKELTERVAGWPAERLVAGRCPGEDVQERQDRR